VHSFTKCSVAIIFPTCKLHRVLLLFSGNKGVIYSLEDFNEVLFDIAFKIDHSISGKYLGIIFFLTYVSLIFFFVNNQALI